MLLLNRESSRVLVVAMVIFAALALTATSPASGEDAGERIVYDPLTEPEISYPPFPESIARFVVGGDSVENPGWITALFRDGSFTCTASLIDPQVVLTAAHCVDSPGNFTAVIGSSYLYADEIRRTVTSIYIHPGWHGDFNDTDLALLLLDQPVTSVPVAKLNATGVWPEFTQPLVVAGWGQYYGGSGAATYLQAGGVYATSGMDGTYDPYYCDLDPSAVQTGEMFCVGGPVTVSACSGDSGGPIAGWSSPSASSGDLVVYGVVSYGSSYCSAFTMDSVAQSIGGNYTWIVSTVDSITKPVSQSGTFADADGSVHESAIEAIATAGITKGCNPPTNDRYCPSSSLTRGQMAAFIRRALSLPSSSTDYFIDDEDSVFEGDINALAEAGITKGCNPPTSDRYCPDGKITREHMAAFLRRAFDYPAATTDYFIDDNNTIFEADINAIAQAGVTRGCNPPTNDRYCPTDLVKRDQMASFFARALDL